MELGLTLRELAEGFGYRGSGCGYRVSGTKGGMGWVGCEATDA